MPRFYFDVREGEKFIPDEEGLEFDSLDAAEREAATAAAEIVGELGLSDRQITGMVVGKADRLEAHQHLTEEVSHALVSFALSNVHHPFPEDGSVDQGLAPEGGGDAGVAHADVAQGLVSDKAHPAGREGAKAAVENLKVQALQVGNVTGDAEGHDLALAVSCHFVGAGEAAQKQTGPGGTIARAHDVLTFLDDDDLHRQVFEGLSLVIGEGEYAVQLADEGIVFGI